MILSKEAISAELKQIAPAKNWHVSVFDQLPSTNDYLREMASPIVHGETELCATDWQTAGHGRRGKQWSSQRGNVTFTLRQQIRRPPVELLGLSLVTGVAVVSVLRQKFELGANLKWPNDVLVDGKKLGGLLIELQAALMPEQGTDVMTGIGLNIRHQPEFDDLGIGATSLERLGISESLDRNALIATISAAVASHYVEFETSGWAVFEQRWREVDALFGRPVTVSGGANLAGTACGVNPSGALLIDSGQGVEAVVAGEVSVRPV